MTKKGCCCTGITGPYDDCCAPIGLHCVGKTIEFQFEITYRYYCTLFGIGASPTSSANYWCENSTKSFPIVNNPEKFIITFTHTIEDPAYIPYFSNSTVGLSESDGFRYEIPEPLGTIPPKSEYEPGTHALNWSCCGVDPRTDFRYDSNYAVRVADEYISNWYDSDPGRIQHGTWSPCRFHTQPDYRDAIQYPLPNTNDPPYNYGCNCVENKELSTCHFSLSPGATCASRDGSDAWVYECPYGTLPYWTCPENPKIWGGRVRTYGSYYGIPFPAKPGCWICRRVETGEEFEIQTYKTGSFVTFPWLRCFVGYHLGNDYKTKVEEKFNLETFYDSTVNVYEDVTYSYCLPKTFEIPVPELILTRGAIRKDTITNLPKTYPNLIATLNTFYENYDTIKYYTGGLNNLQNLNLAQNYSVQFVPNPIYPEQMEDNYVPKVSPILLDFRYNCGVDLERSPGSLTNFGNSLNKNMIEIKLAFSYYNEFNCGTESQPIIEVLDIPFKTFEIDDNLPITDANTSKTNFGCEGTPEGCQPTTRYVFSSPIWLGKFGRRTMRNESKDICIPPSTQTTAFSSCYFKYSKDLSKTYHQDDYTTCFTDGWRFILDDISAISPVYNQQLLDKNYNYRSLKIIDPDNGTSTINFGYCDIAHSSWNRTKQNRIIFADYGGPGSQFRYWANFSDRIDVTS